MERMIIKHLSGSKANQVEEFALKHHTDLILGRDTSATVKYDPDRDDLVGRQHAKIAKDPNSPDGFTLTDLNSTNGTFLNKHRITGTVKLNPGDYVQLGPNGPEFQFEVEPRADNSTKATRIGTSPNMTPATRMVDTTGNAANSAAMPPTAVPMNTAKPAGTVGKATVERMISQTVTETKKTQGRQYGLIGGAAALAVLLLFGIVIGGAYFYNSRQQTEREQKEQDLKRQFASQQEEAASKQTDLEKKIAADKASAAINPTETVEKYGNSVVYIEVAWHLFDADSKSQLYHRFVPNDTRVLAQILKIAPPKTPSKIDPQAGSIIPVYLAVGKSYEPLLTTEKDNLSVPIGGQHRGSGFIVTPDGYILTNRHVGATWMTSYQFPPSTPQGIVLNADGTIAVNHLMAPPTSWVPSQTKQDGKQYSGTIKGINDSLDVTLNGKESRMKGELLQVSDRHDVSLLKINVPGQLTKVELNDNYDSLKKGEQVTIMGYPAASPDVYGVITSRDMFNKEQQLLSIPQVTVTTTNIGNILRDDEKDANDKHYSEYGDVIQLATNSTGGGNSGGPVFDSQGKVIGIFFAGSNRAGTSITYAVPIRFGMEFLAGQ